MTAVVARSKIAEQYDRPTVSVAEALRLARCSHRQMDYAIREGLLADRLRGLGSGHGRTFSPLEVNLLWAIVRVREVGIGAERLRLLVERTLLPWASGARRPLSDATSGASLLAMLCSEDVTLRLYLAQAPFIVRPEGAPDA